MLQESNIEATALILYLCFRASQVYNI